MVRALLPDWLTSFGSIYKIPPMVGGVRFEHSHRMLAEFVGLLTIILTLWTWRADERQWMRRLSIAALAVVIMQGYLAASRCCTFFLPQFLPLMRLSDKHFSVSQ